MQGSGAMKVAKSVPNGMVLGLWLEAYGGREVVATLEGEGLLQNLAASAEIREGDCNRG